MNLVATLPIAERTELFQETANRRGVAIQIIEKDFWVCWTLKNLFELPEIGTHLIFKGGTSLSKIFRVIERFSEDIDVSINREYLGFKGSDDPANIEGSNARRRQLDALQQACIDKIASDVFPSLQGSFEQILGESREDDSDSSWQLTLDDMDPQNLLFAYPRNKSSRRVSDISYIRPVVKIEIGARSDHWPAEMYSISPYAAEEFPEYFGDQTSYVLKVLEAERTFWEKATLLHSEYYRPENITTAERISRHYYDLHRLSQTPISERAVDRLELLNRVVDHKKTFFRQARANYDEAREGKIHLLPHDARIAALNVDYEKMRDMFFGDIPSFNDIIKSLAKLESLINTKVSSRVIHN
jgi:predicted nucleotidyltransferase component of viral defense system